MSSPSFDAELETHGFDDPLLRFVAAMCKLEMEFQRDLVQGPYDEERAQGYARELLMPEGEFAALAWLPDRISPPASASRPSRSSRAGSSLDRAFAPD